MCVAIFVCFLSFFLHFFSSSSIVDLTSSGLLHGSREAHLVLDVCVCLLPCVCGLCVS